MITVKLDANEINASTAVFMYDTLNDGGTIQLTVNSSDHTGKEYIEFIKTSTNVTLGSDTYTIDHETSSSYTKTYDEEGNVIYAVTIAVNESE